MGVRNKYPATVCYPPEMEVIELRVQGTVDTDTLTPASGKRIRVFGFFVSQYVDSASAVTSTLRATLAFGTDHTGTASKILASYRETDVYDDAGSCMCNINVIGDVDEVVTLTNVTYAGGGDEIITRVAVYYAEE